MIFILLLVYLLSNGAGAAPDHLYSRAPGDSCESVKTRSLFDIVWGCLTTLFACTWVSVHPNVPPPTQGPPSTATFWQRTKYGLIADAASLWRRLKLMLIALIAPELMVGFAARQLVFALAISTEFGFSLTQGFFISMGGFVTQQGHPIVTRVQLQRPEYLDSIKQIPAGFIKDKSKRDGLAKGIAMSQGLWFLTQCIARVAQDLPVTTLEVATLAFAAVNVLVWALWWDKPLNVQHPIPVGPVDDDSHTNVESPGHVLKSPETKDDEPVGQTQMSEFWDRFFGLLGAGYSNYDPLLSGSVPSFWSVSDIDDKDDEYTTAPEIAEMLIGTIFGAIHCAAWHASFPSEDVKWMWRSCALLVTSVPLLLPALVTLPEKIATVMVPILFVLFCSLYILARLFLLVIPFTSLQTLPPCAFEDVDWTGYIPHL